VGVSGWVKLTELLWYSKAVNMDEDVLSRRKHPKISRVLKTPKAFRRKARKGV
jgi:hypothetical protein